MNYAIFRSEPIRTIPDLAQIGAHNNRDKKAYDSNPDIDISKTSNNIEIIPLNDTKYVKKFYEITKEYRMEHNERMKTERSERKKTFNQMLNSSQNVVADDLEFNMTNSEYVKNLDRDDLIKFGNVCKDFVIKDLGYNVLNNNLGSNVLGGITTTFLSGVSFRNKARQDIAVIEVGLGGRLDCTNIITPELSIITNISLDHTQFLGNTLAKIAGEKAGIIKEGVNVVIGEDVEETRPVFEAKAKEKAMEIGK